MRIALTFNAFALRTEGPPLPDDPATVAAVVTALEALGHEVVRVDAAASFGEVLVRLRNSRADLTLNLAFEDGSVLATIGLNQIGGVAFTIGPKGATVVDADPTAPPDDGTPTQAATRAATRPRPEPLDEVLRRAIAAVNERVPLRPRAMESTAVPRVALVYNLKRSSSDPEQAEFDSQATVDALRNAIAANGYPVTLLEADADLPAKIDPGAFDIAFNIAEGYRGRGREALVPALLELHRVEYTASDPATLAVTLDKGLAKRVVASAGIRTPKFALAKTGREQALKEMEFPLMVKPVAEGSSKGVGTSSVVRDPEELRARVAEHAERYAQAALVEEFLPGREFTVGMLGNSKLRVLPIMEVVFTDPDTEHPIYGYEQKQDSRGVRFECPARLDPALAREIEKVARRSFEALGCRDVARVDVRLDAQGRPHFIECNPLPGLSPGWSDLCVIALSAGISYEELIGLILRPAVRRWRETKRRSIALSKTSPTV